MGAKKLNTHEKSEIVLLHELGFNQTKIASRLGKNQCSISKFLKRRAERNSNDRKSGSGRPRLSSKRQDKALERLSLKDRFASGTDLRKQWKKASRVKVSARTVRRRLLEMDLPSRKARKTSLKTEKIKAKRLQFAEKYKDWTGEDWKKIIFSDESWFQLFENGRRCRVRRRSGEAYLPECVIQTVKHPEKVMIFGAISPTSKSRLVFIDGRVNAAKYQQILREGRISSFISNHPHPSPIWMEDGAPGHRAASTKKWHQDRGHTLLIDWPGNSPDLNPIENCWSEMKNRLRDERPTSVDGIKRVCQRVWAGITPGYLTKLFESMPRRMEAVIKAGGDILNIRTSYIMIKVLSDLNK